MIAATNTSGHHEIVNDIGTAAILYDPGDARGLAEQLLPYVINRDLLIAAQERAWQAGLERYNWDIEQGEFLRAIDSTLVKIVSHKSTSTNAANRAIQRV
jgi:hypothetical protein